MRSQQWGRRPVQQPAISPSARTHIVLRFGGECNCGATIVLTAMQFVPEIMMMTARILMDATKTTATATMDTPAGTPVGSAIGTQMGTPMGIPAVSPVGTPMGTPVGTMMNMTMGRIKELHSLCRSFSLLAMVERYHAKCHCLTFQLEATDAKHTRSSRGSSQARA